jgi:hypothetical protein
MQRIILILMVLKISTFANAREMSPEDSAYTYKTLAYYTKQSGTIVLERFGCQGNGFRVCSFLPILDTAGSFGWIPTATRMSILLERLVPTQRENNISTVEVFNLVCTPELCTFD